MERKRARLKLKFLDFIINNEFLEIESDTTNELIKVSMFSQDVNSHIVLDIPTAIKLHKTLRSEIAKIKEGGQSE